MARVGRGRRNAFSRYPKRATRAVEGGTGDGEAARRRRREAARRRRWEEVGRATRRRARIPTDSTRGRWVGARANGRADDVDRAIGRTLERARARATARGARRRDAARGGTGGVMRRYELLYVR